MHAIRVRHVYDGESFMAGGATVLVEDGSIIAVEPYGFPVPGLCQIPDKPHSFLARRQNDQSRLARKRLQPQGGTGTRHRGRNPRLLTLNNLEKPRNG